MNFAAPLFMVVPLLVQRHHYWSLACDLALLCLQAGRDLLSQPDLTLSAAFGPNAERVGAALSSLRPFETGKPLRERSR